MLMQEENGRCRLYQLADRNPFKIVLLGGYNVGKSCILKRIMQDRFESDTASTIGALFVAARNFKQTSVDCEFWDTAGQERFAPLLKLYYRAADMVLIVYDVTDAASQAKAREWVNTIKEQLPCAFQIVIGNKVDLVDEKAELERQKSEWDDYLQFRSACHMLASMKTGFNVDTISACIESYILNNNTLRPNVPCDEVDISPAAPRRCC